MKAERTDSPTVSRRTFAALGAGAITTALAGCFGDDPQSDETNGVDGNGDVSVTVAASMPAVWDFVRQVGGDHVEAIDLVPTGEHGHDYDPGPSIVQDIEDSDAFVYLRDFSSWQDSAADELEGGDEVLVIEASEGIEFFDSPAEDNDEHFWMDPIECKAGVDNVADGLAEIDSDHAEDYEANAAAFNEELDALDEEFEEIVERAELNELVVGTHDSFQWWNRRYGIDIYSPVGTSPDDSASPGDVEEVEGLIEEFGIEHVTYDVGEPAELAESLAAETGTEILPLSPIETQIDGSPDVDPDVQMEADWSYVDHFRELNFPTLETALRAEGN